VSVVRVGELARRTGVTVRALRYYEAAGLVVPVRAANGYREYDPIAVRLVEEIRSLTALGLSVEQTRPFVECLISGAEAGDVCPAALATYRRAIEDVERRIGELAGHREALRAQLEAAATRAVLPESGRHVTGIGSDPSRLIGGRMTGVVVRATDGTDVCGARPGSGRTVLFVYPLTGRPGIDLPEGWETIPGARGCTEQVCGFRDHYAELLAADAARVFGLSAQSTGYQRELVHRLRLPYPLLADPRLKRAATWGLPTFEAGGMTLYRRLSLVLIDGLVEHVFYPVAQPALHAEEVVRWLADRPVAGVDG
jgi:peroxiredoxin/DNA-binding transcriptional MerR regulator